MAGVTMRSPMFYPFSQEVVVTPVHDNTHSLPEVTIVSSPDLLYDLGMKLRSARFYPFSQEVFTPVHGNTHGRAWGHNAVTNV